MEPLVSVVIPFYDNLGWLKEAVESVINQTYSNYEIIVINDGSPENIEAFLDQYNDKIRYYYKENGGPATARNFGINKSLGKYIAFLDSDDIWDSSKLSVQIKEMEENDWYWSHSAYRLFGCNENRRISIDGYSGDIFKKILVSSPLATPTIVVKSDIFLRNPELRFNPKMRFGQDYYLWLKLANRFSIGSIKEPLCSVRIRGSNAARRSKIQLRTRSIIWDYLNDTNEKDIRINDVNYSIRLSYRLCSVSNKIINYLGDYTSNESLLEILSKGLYLFPWLILKINKIMTKSNLFS